MRSPLLLALALTFTASTARAASCGLAAFNPGPLKSACPDAGRCLAYEHAFVEACKRELDDAGGKISGLELKPNRSLAEEAKILALDKRILEI